MERWIFVFICFLLASCDDLFESVVEIEVPKIENKMVLISHFDVSTDSLRLYMSHSQTILENDNDKRSLSDAKVTLEKENQNLEIPFANNLEFYDKRMDYFSTHKSSDIFQPGDRVSVTVDHPDFSPISAEAVVPSTPEVGDIVYKVDATKDFDGYDLDELTVELTDHPGEENFYLVSAYLQTDDTLHFRSPFTDRDTFIVRTRQIYLGGDNLIVEEAYGDRVVFNDHSFEGQKNKVRIMSYGFGSSSTPDSLVTVVVTAISHDRYLFEKSLGRIWFNDDNPFVEPDNVHSNIEGGFGVFSIENSLVKQGPIVR